MRKALSIGLLATCLMFGSFSVCQAETRRQSEACLTEMLYHEARGESIQGRIAVAQVALKRVGDKEFGDTVCQVIRQKTVRPKTRTTFCQFSYRCAGVLTVEDQKAWDESYRIASALIDNQSEMKDYAKGAIYYINPKAMSKKAVKTFERGKIRVAVIGSHWFYIDKPKKEAGT